MQHCSQKVSKVIWQMATSSSHTSRCSCIHICIHPDMYYTRYVAVSTGQAKNAQCTHPSTFYFIAAFTVNLEIPFLTKCYIHVQIPKGPKYPDYWESTTFSILWTDQQKLEEQSHQSCFPSFFSQYNTPTLYTLCRCKHWAGKECTVYSSIHFLLHCSIHSQSRNSIFDQMLTS